MGESIEVKVGQMILAGMRGVDLTPDNPIVRDIRERHIGGVVLFDYDVANRNPVMNIESPAQVRDLTDALQEKAHLPLLIAIDQEGGRVNRLKPERSFPPSVSAKFLGELNDPRVTRHHAEVAGMTLASIGVNLNLAPDVDLDRNPANPVIGKLERSFSRDPAIVLAHAREFVEGHHAHGVLCTLKHFPGHGSSSRDTHLEFTDVTATWTEEELEPYAHLISAGYRDAIMTAHIFNSQLDPEFPATLSRRVINGILRERLGFEGVIISDDMQMKAISGNFGFETAVERTINAGVDILSFANNDVYEPDVVGRTVRAVTILLKNGVIGEERIDASYQRIMRLKGRLSRGKPAYPAA